MPLKTPKPKVELKPVKVDGKIILWDIYVDGRWAGSRRTLKQTNDFTRYITIEWRRWAMT